MGFDTASAVAVDDNDGSINTTRFDVNSAHEEPQLQEATPGFFPQGKPTLNEEGEPTANNPATDVTKFFHNLLNRSYEDLRGERAYIKSDNFPKPLPGEDVMHFAERVKPTISDEEAANIRQGTMAQFSKPIAAGMVAGAIFDPVGTAAMVGGFAAKEQFFNIRKIIDKYAPDTPTDIKDSAEIADNLLTGGVLAHGIGVARPMLNAFLNERGLPDATTLSPNVLKGLNDFDAKGVGKLSEEPQVTERPAPFVRTSQAGWPAPDVETPTGIVSGGVLDKLGINQQHFDASMATGLPVKVPFSKLLPLAEDPQWANIKQIMTFEGEGGAVEQSQGEENANQGRESTQSGSGQEGIEGQAQVGVHLWDTQEGGMEAKEGNEIINPQETNEKGELIVPKEEQSTPQIESKKELSQRQDVSSKESIPPEEETGKEKTSGLSKSVEEDAIHKGLIEDLGDLPSYKTRDMDEIAKKVSDFIDKDPELAKKIALGDAPEQDGLRAQELFTGLKAKAFKEGDVPLIHELGTSEKAATMATELGQRVKALDSGDETNPVKIIQDINKSRGKPSKEMINDQGKTAKILKRELAKSKPKIDEWNDFIESIKC